MNYKLNNEETKEKVSSRNIRDLIGLLPGETKSLAMAVVFVLINSATTIAGPLLLGHAIDNFLFQKDTNGIALYSVYLIINYAIGFVSNYLQIKLMGSVGIRLLYKLRNQLFQKLMHLPLSFFNQNKAGDLISRLNNDTDKVNQFFSEVLVQFVGNTVTLLAVGAFILTLNPTLGIVSIAPAIGLLLLTQIALPWMRRRNLTSLQSLGSLSAEIQQSLENFKVIVAFNRRDYFKQKFTEVNATNYNAALNAGIANNVIAPMYDFASNLATLVTLLAAFSLITSGNLTVGVLITYISYLNQFYGPLRRMSGLWASLQSSLAGWGRISEILKLESNLNQVDAPASKNEALMEFKNVNFGYEEGVNVLNNISMRLEQGKVYAFVGPTGGGKTTTAGLIARLFDPTSGVVELEGKDIRSYSDEERTQKVGFILQDPFLFTGSLRENIVYGNPEYAHMNNEQLTATLSDSGLTGLITTFSDGLDTPISANADNISLGQKQIIAFMRAMLRKPKLLILDEATANLDTVTEQVLDEIMSKLPKETTKVVIAHRLNTIRNADDIFFISGGKIQEAGTLDKAIEMLTSKHKAS